LAARSTSGSVALGLRRQPIAAWSRSRSCCSWCRALAPRRRAVSTFAGQLLVIVFLSHATYALIRGARRPSARRRIVAACTLAAVPLPGASSPSSWRGTRSRDRARVLRDSSFSGGIFVCAVTSSRSADSLLQRRSLPDVVRATRRRRRALDAVPAAMPTLIASALGLPRRHARTARRARGRLASLGQASAHSPCCPRTRLICWPAAAYFVLCVGYCG